MGDFDIIISAKTTYHRKNAKKDCRGAPGGYRRWPSDVSKELKKKPNCLRGLRNLTGEKRFARVPRSVSCRMYGCLAGLGPARSPAILPERKKQPVIAPGKAPRRSASVRCKRKRKRMYVKARTTSWGDLAIITILQHKPVGQNGRPRKEKASKPKQSLNPPRRARGENTRYASSVTKFETWGK